MLKIDVDGNQFLVGVFSLMYGYKKIMHPNPEKSTRSLVTGCLLTALGVMSILDSAQAWFDKDAKEEDLFADEED